jgi:hypothetical protein
MRYRALVDQRPFLFPRYLQNILYSYSYNYKRPPGLECLEPENPEPRKPELYLK